MSGTKLDGPGAQKMQTLEDALRTLQQLHGLVERMAMEVNNQKGTGVIPMQIKRAAAPLVGQLKGHFGLLAEQVSAMLLIGGRGGGDQMKVRAYREHIAMLRNAIEKTQVKVRRDHSVDIDVSPE